MGLGRHQRRSANKIGFRGDRDVEHRPVMEPAISCTSGFVRAEMGPVEPIDEARGSYEFPTRSLNL
jgi:hypothetical protein